jgi:hypothetical protein
MAKIYERNPDNGEIRSRNVGEPIGSEKIEKPGITKAQKAISRSEILDEIWSADKHTIDGKWYVSLSDVCAILGEDYARKEQ